MIDMNLPGFSRAIGALSCDYRPKMTALFLADGVSYRMRKNTAQFYASKTDTGIEFNSKSAFHQRSSFVIQANFLEQVIGIVTAVEMSYFL